MNVSIQNNDSKDRYWQDFITTGWINVNNNCNNRCKWCYRQGDFKYEAKSMPFEMATQVIDFFIELGIYSCTFIGGEPTLYPGLTQLVKRAKEGNTPETTVVTNGRLLTKERAKELADVGLDHFSISIHSAVPKIHNVITKNSSWHETICGIKNALDTGKTCSLNIVAGKQNIDSIPSSIPFLLDLGVKEIVISCATPCIDDGKFNASNALNPHQFAVLIEKVKNISDQVLILHELPLCLMKRATFLDLAEKNRLGYGCHIGVGRGLSIDVDGQIIPCNSFANVPILNLFDQGKLKYAAAKFLAIWQNNEEILTLRDTANVYRSEICQICDLWQLCNCGCPLTWSYFDPKDYISDSLLGIDQKTIENWTIIKLNP